MSLRTTDLDQGLTYVPRRLSCNQNPIVNYVGDFANALLFGVSWLLLDHGRSQYLWPDHKAPETFAAALGRLVGLRLVLKETLA